MDIRDKVRKLLNLADSPNEHEAKSALLHARALMAKHKLTEADISKDEEKEFVRLTIKDEYWTTDSGDIYMVDLAKVISESYLCGSAWSTPYKTRTHILVLYGFKEDVELCEIVFRYANNQIKKYRNKSVRHSYARGFISGLEEAFKTQEELNAEWGLVMVQPKEVAEVLATMTSKSVRSREGSISESHYSQGYQDGKRFSVRDRLEERA